jgi:hypothetical protein
MDNLKKMLQQKGIQLLDLASASYMPGHLVKIHCFWRFGDFGPEIQLQENRGLATDVLKLPSLALAPRIPADIVIQNVTDQFHISAGAGLPQFGLSATGDINSGVTVSWNISSVETVAFADEDVQTYFSTVLPKLRKFADSDPKNNGWIKECYLIKQVFFAAAITGTIHTAGTLDGKTAFSQAGVTGSADIAMTWSADNTTFVVQGSNEIPFAVRGDAIG